MLRNVALFFLGSFLYDVKYSLHLQVNLEFSSGYVGLYIGIGKLLLITIERFFCQIFLFLHALFMPPNFKHSYILGVGLFFLLMESWVVSLQLISFCLSRIGLIVQDHSDPMFSSYAYKSHYLLNESNRAELMKLPMIPSSSASKKKCEKGKNQNSFSLLFLHFLFFFSKWRGGMYACQAPSVAFSRFCLGGCDYLHTAAKLSKRA